jgi:toxin ParE1/3/4
VNTRQLRYHPVALEQLDTLWDYIAAARSPEVAEGYLSSIFEFCDGLNDFPSRGVARDDLRPGLRTIGFRRRAVIAFVLTETAVEIVGFYYGGRDYETLLTSDDE